MSQSSDRYAHFRGIDESGLYLVSPAQSHIRPTCDIILLHGLNGGPAKTWRHPETDKIWFQDYLPDDIIDERGGLNARIWTYGYNANTAFRAAKGTQSFDFAHQLLERVSHIREGFEHYKIIWICHSLGGIVVKTALIEARLNPEYTSILQSTVGILFLGTPHQGSSMANVTEIAASVAGAMLPSVLFMANRTLIKSLRQDCDGLFETAGRFANLCTSIKIYNVYETLPIAGRLIVERRSALMNLQGETGVPLNANHRTLCKFEDNNDNNYRVIRDIVQKLLRLSGSSNRSRAPHRVQNVQGDPRPPRNHPISQVPGGQPSGIQGQASQTTQRLPYPNTTSSSLPTDTPNLRAQTYQHERGRAVSENGPNIPRITEASIPKLEKATFRQHPVQEPARAVSAGPTSRSTPYSMVRPESSIENLSAGVDAFRPFTSAGTKQDSTRLSPSATAGQRRNVSQPATGNPASEDQATPGTLESTWTCDVCGNGIPLYHVRVHCLQCDDYDLCGACSQAGRISKSHRPDHAMRHIIKTIRFLQEAQDLIPPGDIVHPQTSPGRMQPNWSVEQDIRCHHLLKYNGHARFLAASIEPGHYRIIFYLNFDFSSQITQSHLDALAESGFGNLRLAGGIINSKQQFFKERFVENESLVTKLFSLGIYDDCKIMPGQNSVIEIDEVFHLESKPDRTAELGFLLQWSDMRSFVKSDEPLVHMSFVEVRLEDLLDYNVTSASSSSPSRTSAASASSTTSPTPSKVAAPSAASPQPAVTPTTEASDLSYADLCQAILDAAQEQQTQQEMEAFYVALHDELRRRQQEQVRAQEEAEARALLQRIGVFQQAQRQKQNYQSLRQLGLLQAYLNSALND